MKQNKFSNYLLYLYSFAIPFEYWDPFGLVGYITLVRLIAIFYIITRIYESTKIKNPIKTVTHSHLILIFFLYLTLINFLSRSFLFKELATMINFTLLQNIILYYFLVLHFKQSRTIYLSSLIAFCLGVVLMGILFVNDVGLVYRVGRVSIFGDNPNNQGTKVAFGILILFFVFLRDSLKIGKFRFILLLPIPILIQFILATASRGAILTLATGILLLLILGKSKTILEKSIFVISASLVIFYIYTLSTTNEVLLNRMNNIDDIESLGGRTEIWESTISIFIDSPLFGVGESNFENRMMLIYGVNKSAHNYFLYVLATSGIIGLFLFSWFLYAVLKDSLKLFRIRQYFFIILYFEVLFGMFRQGGTLGDKFYWYILAMIVGVYNIRYNSNYNLNNIEVKNKQ